MYWDIILPNSRGHISSKNLKCGTRVVHPPPLRTGFCNRIRARERRPLAGMLLDIDGSRYRCFQDKRWHDLIVILDDATSEIYYGQLTKEESTIAVMAGLRALIEEKGLFCALYSARGAHFCATHNSGDKVDYDPYTQVSGP